MEAILFRTLAVSSLAVALCSTANAGFIDNLSSWDGVSSVSRLGFDPNSNNGGYYAQTFIAPDASLDTLSFVAKHFDSAGVNTPGDVYFNVLITSTVFPANEPSVLHPDSVLFESGPFLLAGGSPFTQYDVSLGGLALNPGDTMMWMIDTVITANNPIYDGNDPGSIAVATSNGFADGQFITGGRNSPSTTRQGDFELTQQWAARGDDLAFRITHDGTDPPPPNAIPEPSSLALLGMGGLSLFGYGWRRRRKTELSA